MNSSLRSKCSRLKTACHLPGRVVLNNRNRGEVRDCFPLITDDFALSAWRPLYVVLLQMDGKRPAAEFELHQSAGDIFHIHFQTTEMAANSVQAARLAKQGVEVVELVNLGKHHTASQVRT